MPAGPSTAAPLVMGILNTTPDSFSDGGLFLDPEAAIANGLTMFSEGADIVDVGGESSRPGADPVDEEVELLRVVPVIEALSQHGRVSVDTTKESVARAAIEAGATLLNDVSASLWEVAADTGTGWVAMHRRGTARDMQDDPHYEDVVGEVRSYLVDRAEAALEAGVGEVWIDPGIGFGKTFDHNWTLLRHVGAFVETGFPVLVGTSRKRFLGSVPHGGAEAPPCDRLEQSVATATWAMVNGAAMVRVHDVLATVQALKVVFA